MQTSTLHVMQKRVGVHTTKLRSVHYKYLAARSLTEEDRLKVLHF